MFDNIRNKIVARNAPDISTEPVEFTQTRQETGKPGEIASRISEYQTNEGYKISISGNLDRPPGDYPSSVCNVYDPQGERIAQLYDNYAQADRSVEAAAIAINLHRQGIVTDSQELRDVTKNIHYKLEGSPNSFGSDYRQADERAIAKVFGADFEKHRSWAKEQAVPVVSQDKELVHKATAASHANRPKLESVRSAGDLDSATNLDGLSQGIDR
jgi:hypothetical protein